MRIKIIGENNCARATRHLLRLAGFAVTEFLPADAVAGGPLAGYAITIDLAPARHTSDAHLRPDPPTHQQDASAREEAPRSHRDASSPAFVRQTAWRTTAGEPACDESAGCGANLGDVPAGEPACDESAACGANFGEVTAGEPTCDKSEAGGGKFGEVLAGLPAVAPANFRSEGGIHFDSVECALEAAVLRHVTQLAAAPVIVDRPGGVVHSDRELRIVAPNTGDARGDEAAAVAIEFGVLRGLLDLTAGASAKPATGLPAEDPEKSLRSRARKWWPFGILLLAAGLGVLRAGTEASAGRGVEDLGKTNRLKPVLLLRAAFAPEFLAEAQGQFATGPGLDPCKGVTKLFASISQTGNTQLVAGTAAKKIYVCSIHVVAAAATNVAVVEGTGSACATGTAGVSGFGGATAATGWNFAANGGIALGNGDSSLGAEGTSGDNLCIFNSGSGQVSGGISYVVE